MNWKNFLLLLLLALLWAPSFLFIKIAVGEIPPLTLVTGRVGIATLLLYIILRIQGRKLPKFGPIWKHFAIAGFFSNALPFVLFSWGEMYVDSALASILNGTTPMFTILFAHFLTSDDRINPLKIIGSVFGFGGLVILITPSILNGVYATTLGLLAMVVAAASYGIGLVYTRQKLRGLQPLVGPTAQLGMATLYLLPLSLVFDQPFTISLPSWPALTSLFALASLGTAVAFVLYYHLLELTSASYVSMVTYVVPIFGVILGIAILSEQPGWFAYTGCALIIVGMMIVNGVIRIKIPYFSNKALAEG